MRTKILDKLQSLNGGLELSFPVFLSLMGFGVDDPEWANLAPSRRRRQILDALKELLALESLNQPLVLVLEDIHWIDGETQALLDELVNGIATARILLLVNFRPEYTHDWENIAHYHQLRLNALPNDSADALLEFLLGSDPELAELRHLLLLKTQGNPFFLEEAVRSLVETGLLIGKRGAYNLASPITNLRLPPTVQSVIAARIDRLAPEDKQLLQVASVIGREVPFTLLQVLAGQPQDLVLLGLSRLQSAEFLYEVRLFPDIAHVFNHVLTQEIAYGSLLSAQRSDLHGRVVKAIEELYPDRLTEHLEQLAQHAIRARTWEKAAGYCRSAGVKAASRSAYAEAVEYFEQALQAIANLPQTRAAIEQAIDVRFALRTALTPFDKFDRCLILLREAETLAAKLDDRFRLGTVSIHLSGQLYYTGRYDEAAVAAKQALSIAEATDNIVMIGSANLRLGLAWYAQGRYREAIGCFERTVAARESSSRQEKLDETAARGDILARALLAECHAEVGTFEQGLAHGQEGRRIAEGLGHFLSLMWSLQGLGRLFLRQGDLANALPVLEKAMAMCREWKLTHWFPRMAAPLGSAYALAGRTAEALPLLTKAAEQTVAKGLVAHRVSCHLALGEAQLHAGHLDTAAALANDVLTHSRAHQERGLEAYGLRLVADILSRRMLSNNSLAESHYESARALSEELGMRPLVAHCHLGIGILYQRIGKREDAQAHFAAARVLYRSMAMSFWLQAQKISMLSNETISNCSSS